MEPANPVWTLTSIQRRCPPVPSLRPGLEEDTVCGSATPLHSQNAHKRWLIKTPAHALPIASHNIVHRFV